MQEAKLYYTAPSDKVFEEVKKAAIEIWTPMGDEPTYAQEKIARIKDIKNVSDNLMYMVAMFDIQNQAKLAEKLSAESRKEIRDRMIDGGNPSYLIPF